ncbi:MAG: hypothetical protein IKW90_15045 [Lachnospiraceae bacterium]|nr:hypothetical protein [Lachnospiraceae bacterium]
MANFANYGNLESILTTYANKINDKADKVVSATNGDLASLDSNGNLADSGVALNISSPTNGQVLGYNSTSGKWENQNASGGSGSTMSKTRYTISSSSWSASANVSGYYTYSVTLNPTLSTSFCPNVSLSGSSDSTMLTDTQKSMYDLVNYYDNTATNTLVLYAKTKPTSTFYIYVEGVNN